MIISNKGCFVGVSTIFFASRRDLNELYGRHFDDLTLRQVTIEAEDADDPTKALWYITAKVSG